MPSTSHSSVHTTSFWNTIGSVHQSPKSPSPPMPGVVEITSSAPRQNTTSFTTYSR